MAVCHYSYLIADNQNKRTGIKSRPVYLHSAWYPVIFTLLLTDQTLHFYYGVCILRLEGLHIAATSHIRSSHRYIWYVTLPRWCTLLQVYEAHPAKENCIPEIKSSFWDGYMFSFAEKVLLKYWLDFEIISQAATLCTFLQLGVSFFFPIHLHQWV